jgi:hypothetical protein
VVLFAFVWMELANPLATSARPLGIAVGLYTALALAGMARYGRATWNTYGEGFAVYFALLARCAPIARDDEGRVVLRPPLAGLPALAPTPGLVAFVAVMLGSTTFDGLSRIPLWNETTGAMTPTLRVAAATAGLLAVILAVWGAYQLAMFAAASVSGSRRDVLAVRYAHSLVPIALAYVVAHYFSLLLIEGQQGLSAISDPFGLGWDLFGTAAWQVNLTIVSITVVWYVQVVAIIAGHIGSVVLAHDRAVAQWEPRLATRTQYAFLAVMVLFTIVGLFILSGG